MARCCDDDDTKSDDSQYAYDDLTFFEACVECDADALQCIIDEGVTDDEVNEQDRSGRTAISHACGSGFTQIVDILTDLEEVDPNLPDKEGNTPLIFAAQAGHVDVVKLLLDEVKEVNIDQTNKLGFTALMKAAIQGRNTCSKALLFAGANAKMRDNGRKLCAEEWARFCGRTECAHAIAKLSNPKRFHIKSLCKDHLDERSNSEPTLFQKDKSESKGARRWIKKLPKFKTKNYSSLYGPNEIQNPFATIVKCVSTPILPDAVKAVCTPPMMRRPISTGCLKLPKLELVTPTGDREDPVYAVSKCRKTRKILSETLDDMYLEC